MAVDRRKITIGLVVAAVIALPLAAWLAFGYFEVQQIWLDDEVDEELTTFVDDPSTATSGPTPTAPPESEADAGPGGTAPPDTAPVAPAQPVRVATGMFTGVEGHRVAGTANLIANPDGSHLLQFPDLDAENGPDLVVWLSVDGSSDDIVDLGELKGNIGNQEYVIPADVDVSRFNTAVIWCRRFSVGFGEAPLSPV
jgi:hypothetical protein